MGAAKSDNEYVVEVKLKGARRVSRTIALRGDQTLDDLHEAIFAAFDRFDPHLYSFYFPKAPRRRRAAGPEPKEYTAPPMFVHGTSNLVMHPRPRSVYRSNNPRREARDRLTV
jgi:hypothetical protein